MRCLQNQAQNAYLIVRLKDRPEIIFTIWVSLIEQLFRQDEVLSIEVVMVLWVWEPYKRLILPLHIPRV